MKQIALLLAVTFLLTGCGCSAPEPADITERSSASVTQTAESTESADVTRTVEVRPDSTAEAQNNETTVPTETERTTAAADAPASGSPANTGTQRNAGSAEARNTTAAGTSQTATSKTTPKVTTNTTRGTVTTNKTTTTTTKKNNGSEPEIDGYKLSEIVNNQRAYAAFFAQLAYDMGHVDGYMVKFPGVSFSFGGTEGTGECRFFLALLNSEYLDYFCDDVMSKFSSRSRFEYLAHDKEFCSKVYYTTKKLGTSVDYRKYTLDYDKGVLLNKIVDSSNKGTLNHLSIPNKYKDDVAVLNLLYSCGINTDYSYMDPFLDQFSLRVYGKPFTENSKTYTK